MRALCVVAVTALCVSLPAQAQRARSGDRPQRPQAGASRERGEGFGQMSLVEVGRRMAARLELTDDQRAQFDKIVAKHTNEWAEAQNVASQRRELSRQAREAKQSGNDKRAEELRAQIEKLGSGPPQVLAKIADEVKPLLTEDQVVKLEQFQQQRQQRAGQAMRAAGARELIQRLPVELNLDADQKVKYDALVAEQRQTQQEIQPLMQELRRARQGGQEQRVAELEKEIAAKRGDGMKGFFEKLQPILTAEQKAKLAELQARIAGTRAGADNVRVLLQAARKLDLTDEQKTRLREITRSAGQALRGGEMNADARAAAAARIKKQIVEMLDAKQTAEFEKLLQAPPRPGPGDMPRRERTRQGQPDKPTGGQPV